MQIACYEGHDAVADWLSAECGVGKWESELVVADPAWMAAETQRYLQEEDAHRAAVAAEIAAAATARKPFAFNPNLKLLSPNPPPNAFARSATAAELELEACEAASPSPSPPPSPDKVEA